MTCVVAGGDLMMLPADIALIEDSDFKKWVEVRQDATSKATVVTLVVKI